MIDKDTKIFIAGHRGLVGSAVYRRLQAAGCTRLLVRTRDQLDLTRQADVDAFFAAERPALVFLAAAKVGGIYANNTYPADFIYQNLAIQTHLIAAARQSGVERLLFLGSSCIYPRACPQPMKEVHLLGGPLEPTNQSYAVAKIAGIIQCDSFNRQYGTRFLAAMPANLYGPNDTYDLKNAHVLPAMIRKFHLAKLACGGRWDAIRSDEAVFGPIPADIRAGLAALSRAAGCSTPPAAETPGVPAAVSLWGSGQARREFLHVDDLAEACVFLMGLSDGCFESLCRGEDLDTALPLINVGSGEDCTIAELACRVADIVGYNGRFVWDRSKPDGVPRKLLDVSRMKRLGWQPRIALRDGIRSAYEDYLEKGARPLCGGDRPETQ